MTKYLRAFVVLLLAVGGNAYAIPVTMQFTVAGFHPLFGSNAAPTDPVTGTIVWDAASRTSNINSLSSIDLTLNGHTYALGEVGFISPYGGGNIIGGTLSGLPSVADLSDDFWIVFGPVNSDTPDVLVGIDFLYASPTLEGIWSAGASQFTQFSITVPEPATLALLCLGLAGFGLGRRNKNNGQK